ncbi:MAG: type II secretion system protein [Phycisphaeraceae bacterium]|nr:type II secretion system protein [Phycisphaeraceae bacterium]
MSHDPPPNHPEQHNHRPSPRSISATILTFAVAAVFAAAAVGKAADPSQALAFVRFLLRHWFDAPDLARPTLAIVVAVEAAVALSLFSGWLRRLFIPAAVALLAAFSAVSAWAIAAEGTPDCGCLGPADRFIRLGTTPQAAIARNAALAAALVWAVVQRTNTRNKPTAPAHVPRRAAGFSLLEVLVVIAVIAILVSLSLPAMREARISARTTRSLSTSKMILLALNMYGSDNNQRFPFFATPGDPNGPKILLNQNLPVSYLRGQSWYYATLLVPNYVDSRSAIEQEGVEERLASLKFPPDVVRSDHFLTYTAFAAPNYWVGDRAPTEPALFRAMQWDELRFTSRKGILLDHYAGLFDRLRPHHERARRREMSVGLGDGAARIELWPMTSENLVDRTEHGAPLWPILTTRNGFNGYDF